MFILQIFSLFGSIGGPGGMFDFTPRRRPADPAPPVMQAPQPQRTRELPWTARLMFDTFGPARTVQMSNGLMDFVLRSGPIMPFGR